MKRALPLVGPLVGLVLTATAIPAERPVAADRDPFIAPGTRTTDDPRRIPLAPGPRGPAGTLVLRGGLVFDAVKPLAAAATVVIERDRIKAVLAPNASDWPADATVIDVSGKLVMPGLIDMHVHLTYPDPNTLVDEQTSEGAGVLRGVRNARYFLESGFTSLRDLGGVLNAPYLLSEWSASSENPAPRIFTAGHIITATGGHAAERPITPNHTSAYTWEVDGADNWRRAVRETYKQGASVIKIASHFSAEEVAAAVDEAHSLGLKITCHCYNNDIPVAVEAGVDMIEHPLPRTDATVRLMAKKGTASIPTLQVYQNVFDTSGYYGTTSRRFSMNSQQNFELFKKMKAAGIKMGVGTDTIGKANTYTPNFYIAELKWFVKGGYTPSEALVAATRTNAQLLDMEDKLGTLEPGKLADVIVVNGRPDQSLDDLAKVDVVIKGGSVLVKDGLLQTARHVAVPLPKPSPPANVN
jgi:imidazolonepropionase-like amidohydrolase